MTADSSDYINTSLDAESCHDYLIRKEMPYEVYSVTVITLGLVGKKIIELQK